MPGQRLVNKVAIVTGSSQGFGREICCEFHLEGAFLVCADLKPLGDDGAIATHESIQQQGGRAIFVKTDVSVAADVEALVAKTVAEYGRVDMHGSSYPPDIE
jgi:NAD(P)-dependent dehydrogenase (short-subunit alcohol dehydrogenase family)